MEKLNKYLVLLLIAVCSAYTLDGFTQNENAFENNTIESEVAQSIEHGTPFLGVTVENTSNNQGVRVVSIEDDSPAAKQDIAIGDLIVAIGEQQVTNMTDFELALSSQGLTPYVIVDRAGEKMYKKVTMDPVEVTIEKVVTKTSVTPTAKKQNTAIKKSVKKTVKQKTQPK